MEEGRGGCNSMVNSKVLENLQQQNFILIFKMLHLLFHFFEMYKIKNITNISCIWGLILHIHLLEIKRSFLQFMMNKTILTNR